MVAVANRLFAAIESGDVDTVRDLFTEDARIWHNVDGIEQTRDENLRTLAWVVENLADRRYGDVTCQPTPTGFVQQHVLPHDRCKRQCSRASRLHRCRGRW